MASAYRRRCRQCQRWISLRQMPAGQWVAFEDEEPHDCKRVPTKVVRRKPKPPLQGSNKRIEMVFEEIEIPSQDENKPTSDLISTKQVPSKPSRGKSTSRWAKQPPVFEEIEIPTHEESTPRVSLSRVTKKVSPKPSRPKSASSSAKRPPQQTHSSISRSFTSATSDTVRSPSAFPNPPARAVNYSSVHAPEHTESYERNRGSTFAWKGILIFIGLILLLKALVLMAR
jgi:hypothetical protein